MSSREGFKYTESSGLTTGLPCEGVVLPPVSLKLSETASYDVIVLGAGYAGLIAARDLTTQGKAVLLVEARDRIGGRTWTSKIDGYPYEMGGTWIHWNQGHAYREITRYGLQDQIVSSKDYTYSKNYCSMALGDSTTVVDHESEGALLDKGLRTLCDVDGQLGKTVLPFPHNPHYTASAAEWDQLSMSDRLRQIEGELTTKEMLILEAFLLHSGGGTLENMGFFDILRWWGLCGYCTEGVDEYGLKFKLKCGQTGLALKIFEEAKRTGNLSYSFDNPVQSVDDNGQTVSAKTRTGLVFHAKRIICTIPLNVLHSVAFNPPLSNAKEDASRLGHINKATKLHAEVDGPHLRSWTGIRYPSELLFGYGDGITPAGNTHLVLFGSDLGPSFQPDEDIEKTKEAINKFHDMDLKQLVFHNWSKDEYSRGAWCNFRTGFATKYLGALRAAHGNIHFASSDWALGWRGFIDGAIEDGARAAYVVGVDLEEIDTSKI
ncbi:hypothetical protein VTL71DRAFT_4867 [Oculimacula yallundae]|uniref:Amine oxidase n=1 Tax=Oculimacula yallundae TaxID=86028 RepID=A0ABR4C5K8_9HELO